MEYTHRLIDCSPSKALEEKRMSLYEACNPPLNEAIMYSHPWRTVHNQHEAPPLDMSGKTRYPMMIMTRMILFNSLMVWIPWPKRRKNYHHDSSHLNKPLPSFSTLNGKNGFQTFPEEDVSPTYFSYLCEAQNPTSK